MLLHCRSEDNQRLWVIYEWLVFMEFRRFQWFDNIFCMQEQSRSENQERNRQINKDKSLYTSSTLQARIYRVRPWTSIRSRVRCPSYWRIIVRQTDKNKALLSRMHIPGQQRQYLVYLQFTLQPLLGSALGEWVFPRKDEKEKNNKIVISHTWLFDKQRTVP